MEEKQSFRFALAGNPNCGKTTLFNSLTGSTAYVGNWPGVTVEKREGTYKGKGIGEAKIVDLPGIYSLSPYTPEEVISRNYILDEKPDVVINVIDSTNLERNLYMTTQILEMDVPVVLALNMIDALEEANQEIDAELISKKLGIPVVKVSALRSKNLDQLMEAAFNAAQKERKSSLLWADKDSKKKIDEATEIYKKDNVANPVFHAVKALEGDEIEAEANKLAYGEVNKAYPEAVDFQAESADKRYQFITKELAPAIKGKEKHSKEKLSKSDKIDKVLTNKWAAIPIMIVIMFLIFHITFTGDLFYMNRMGLDLGTYEGAIAITIGEDTYHPFEGLFYDGGIIGFGEFLHVLVGDNETGLLGCICLGIKAGLTAAGSPEWLIQFLNDGVLNGIAAVLGFLPQILLLFFFFSLLEDSGYMARVAFVLDRIFRKFGVSGRAFLPMVMGFGCGVPAMINTRTLSSDKERTKTIRVIPYFTCGAKAEILTLVSAAVAGYLGWDAGLFTFGMYVMGVVMAIAMVILMNKTTQREKVPPFIMELPAYHRPQMKATFIHVWDKAKHFIKKAFTIIFVSTIVIWFFQSFTWNWIFIPNYNEDMVTEIQALGFTSFDALQANSILACIGKIIQPLFTPLGFGVQTGSYGWVYGVATIQGIVAKEAVTSTLASLAALVHGESVVEMFAATGITAGGVMGFTVFNLLTIPCFASVATAKGELADRKAYLGTILFWILGAYVIGSIFYVFTDAVVGNWGLAAAICVPIAVIVAIAGLCIGVFFYNKKKNAEEAAA